MPALCSFAALLALVGCAATEPAGRQRRDAPPPRDTGGSELTGSTGHTGDTAPTDTAPEGDPDCVGDPPPGPFAYAETMEIRTEEDFDFDGFGYLLSQDYTSLQGIDQAGRTHTVATDIGFDAAGIRSLSTGDIVVAQPDNGTLRLVDHATGGSSVILGGLDFPNGLEATADGRVFSSEFAENGYIRLIDPYTGEVELIVQLDYPNNMALSPDEQTLYVVVTHAPRRRYVGQILALDRDDAGVFGKPRLVLDHDEPLGGITTDKCGNVYAAEYNTGEVFRIRISDGVLEPILQLHGSWHSSLRFAPGFGGWERTQLFAGGLFGLTRIELGIEGRHVLAPRP